MKTKIVVASIFLMSFTACHHSPPPQRVTKLFAQSQKTIPDWVKNSGKIDFGERGSNGDVESTDVPMEFTKEASSSLRHPIDYEKEIKVFVKSVPESLWTTLRTSARRTTCDQARSIMRYYANNTLKIKHPKFIQKEFWQEYITTFGGKTKISSATVSESCYVTLKKEVVKNACTQNQGANQKNKACLPDIGKKSGGLGPAKTKAPGTQA